MYYLFLYTFILGVIVELVVIIAIANKLRST